MSTATRPESSGRELNAYAAAEIRSDHEALTAEEGRERLRAGMWLLILEASVARTCRRCCRSSQSSAPARSPSAPTIAIPRTSSDNGHLNGMVREAVAAGIRARGRDRARVVQPRDLASPLAGSARSRPAMHGGPARPARPRRASSPRIVLKKGRTVDEIERPEVPHWVRAPRVRIAPVAAADFRVPWEGGRAG